ncbi:unnamed protein product [Closterium sp. NIES-64]|nr:unnamed protein product [Closterium sp. NIES-64]
MAPDFAPRFTAHVPVAAAAGFHQPTDPLLDDSFVGYRGRASEILEDEEEMEDATIDDYKTSGSRGVIASKHATLAAGGSSNLPRHTSDPAGRRSANHSAPPAKTPSPSAAKAAAAAALAVMTAFHPPFSTPYVAAPNGPLLPNPVLFRTVPVSVGGLVGGLVSPDPRYRFGAGRVGAEVQGGGRGREGRGHGLGQGKGSERGNVSVASKAALDDEIESYMAEKYQGKGGRS